ncbi:MAG: 2-C-methyl-D-erythritol 4-phosphate cytidylyltransferase [Micrococcus sp.]|nr:2-C-methyl-D-erythritol 4-phosphate cytidylyltransferase [Micrococcus sp.]
MRSTLLIVAAGSGSRLQAGLHKALVDLGDGRTMLQHCLDSVARAGRAAALDLARVVVVVPADADAAEPLEHVCRDFATRTGLPVDTVPGGAERADSVRAGLAAVRAGAMSDHTAGPFGRHAVLVHDAARPFVPPSVFRAVTATLEAGAAAVVPGLPVVDTIKTVSVPGDTREKAASDAEEGSGLDDEPEWVTGTPSRAALRAVQTPQGFDLTALEAAHRAAAGGSALTDDAMVMEAAGHRVAVVPGDPLGFKVTTPLDLVLARALLQEER